MTPARARITEHLAEKVLGWKSTGSHLYPRLRYEDANGRFMRPCQGFDPLGEPDEAALVMEAWRQGEHTLTIGLDNASHKYTAIADYGEPNAGVGGPSESWTEAACEAIARASGWKEGE